MGFVATSYFDFKKGIECARECTSACGTFRKWSDRLTMSGTAKAEVSVEHPKVPFMILNGCST